MEGLLDTDNSKRTPVHLAAICGQGEVVNFFLDRGGLWSHVFKLLSLKYGIYLHSDELSPP